MASNGAVIGSIIGAVIGSMLLLTAFLVVYCYWCCVVYVGQPDEKHCTSELRFQTDHRRRRRVLDKFMVFFKKMPEVKDMEAQIDINKPPTSVTNCETNFNSNSAASRLALKSGTLPSIAHDSTGVCNGNVKDVSIVPCLNKGDDISSVLEYKDAIEKFDMLTEGLLDGDVSRGNLKNGHLKNSRRLTSLTYKKDSSGSNNFTTIVSKPSLSEQSYISDQYDSFTRTLMLQNLIENSINTTKKLLIKDIKDPFLANVISVGGIVVVVKLFQGTTEFEFNFLKPGDLLRIVRFYVKEPDSAKDAKSSQRDEISGNSMDITDFQNSSKNDPLDREEIHVDKSDPNYGNIYCTGILLNTYLEFNKETCDLSLSFKKNGTVEGEFEFLKDFPLKIVSLETTVLKTLSDSPIINDTIEGHFS